MYNALIPCGLQVFPVSEEHQERKDHPDFANFVIILAAIIYTTLAITRKVLDKKNNDEYYKNLKKF